MAILRSLDCHLTTRESWLDVGDLQLHIRILVIGGLGGHALEAPEQASARVAAACHYQLYCLSLLVADTRQRWAHTC